MSRRTQYYGIINPRIQKVLRARPVDLTDGSGQGIALRIGGYVYTISEEAAVRFSNKIIDAVEAINAPAATPQPAKAPTEPQPCYSTRTDSLTAADGVPEPDLPATPAE